MRNLIRPFRPIPRLPSRWPQASEFARQTSPFQVHKERGSLDAAIAMEQDDPARGEYSASVSQFEITRADAERLSCVACFLENAGEDLAGVADAELFQRLKHCRCRQCE
jgi:hypothetical protein